MTDFQISANRPLHTKPQRRPKEIKLPMPQLVVNVLFDLDGTLSDPREGIVACFKYTLLELGYCVPPDSDLERYIGPPLRRNKPKIERDP